MMTASSKLEIKKIDRSNLWYNKYRYKLVVTDNNLSPIRYCDDFEDYCKRMYTRPKGKEPYLDPKKLNEKLIRAIYKIKGNEKIKLRLENFNLSIFSDDLSLYDDILKCTAKNVELQEAILMPAGVIVFKKFDPPAKYRIYMSGKSVSRELKDELEQYINKNPDIKPSSVLERYISNKGMYRIFVRNTFYADKIFFLNYDNEHHAMMLHILFPGMFGKNYKLEKMSD